MSLPANQNQDQDQGKVLMLAIKAGEILIRSGAEIYRADDAVKRICVACGITYVETFTTPTGIILSLGQGMAHTEAAIMGSNSSDVSGALENDTEQRLGTIVKRVSGISTDLEKVSRISHFIDDFSKGNVSVDEGLKRLLEIEKIKPFKLPVRIFAVSLTALFFAMMNGSDLVGALCSLGIGAVSYLVSCGIERLKINRFITIFTSCAVATALSLSCFNLGLGSSLSAMIVGSIIVFLPGVAITNAARDLLAGDMLSGVARIVEAFLVAIALAGSVVIILQIVPSAIFSDVVETYHPALQFGFAFLGTLGLSLMINIPKRYLLLVSLVAGCGWVVYDAIISNAPLIAAGSVKPVACFAGACTVALLAEIFTRITRDAATVFIIPAIFPFVPGIGMYRTLSYVLSDKLTEALHTGLETMFMAGGIAFALLVVISVTRVARMIAAWLHNVTNQGSA